MSKLKKFRFVFEKLVFVVKWSFIGVLLSILFSIVSVIWKDAAPAFHSMNLFDMILWIFITLYAVSVFGWIILNLSGLAPESTEEKLEKRVEELEKTLNKSKKGDSSD